MYTRKAYRTLDRPLMFFGLEIEDIFAIFIVSSVIMFAISPLLAAGFAVACGFFMRRLKEGKPSGYVFYLMYKKGLLNFLTLFQFPHLVWIPPGGARGKVHFSCVEDADVDKENPYEKFYWGGRERL
jgi:hypothetical protein